MPGLLTSRGNATHTYYGQGPVPSKPTVLGRFPDQPMCMESVDQNGPSQWCGTPAVWKGRVYVARGPAPSSLSRTADSLWLLVPQSPAVADVVNVHKVGKGGRLSEGADFRCHGFAVDGVTQRDTTWRGTQAA